MARHRSSRAGSRDAAVLFEAARVYGTAIHVRARPAEPDQSDMVAILVRALAEDKRFELLRVSPTRFPILLLTVRRESGPYVTRHDGTERTFPVAAERLRMRRKLRRTARRFSPAASPGSAPRDPATLRED